MGNSTGGGPSPGTADSPQPTAANKAKRPAASTRGGSGRPSLADVAADRAKQRVVRVRNTSNTATKE